MPRSFEDNVNFYFGRLLSVIIRRGCSTRFAPATESIRSSFLFGTPTDTSSEREIERPDGSAEF